MSVPSPDLPGEAERARLDRATASIDPPFAVLDLDALDANADDLVRRAAGKPIRVASKSVRSRGVLRRVLGRPGFAGVLAYSLHEALWWAARPELIIVSTSATRRNSPIRRAAIR
jgi:D-serine deaminase-like pyridoxal phosphate-dependent protein